MKDLSKKIQREKKVIEGESTKDLFYSSQREFQDKDTAQKEFSRSVDKLFHVNNWSALPGFSSTFQLHNPQGVQFQQTNQREGITLKSCSQVRCRRTG